MWVWNGGHEGVEASAWDTVGEIGRGPGTLEMATAERGGGGAAPGWREQRELGEKQECECARRGDTTWTLRAATWLREARGSVGLSVHPQMSAIVTLTAPVFPPSRALAPRSPSPELAQQIPTEHSPVARPQAAQGPVRWTDCGIMPGQWPGA